MRNVKKPISVNSRVLSFVALGGVISGFSMLLIILVLFCRFPHLFEGRIPAWLVVTVLSLIMIIVSLRRVGAQPEVMNSQDEFDPSEVSDPIAKKIEWTTTQGGASFCTHRLVKVSTNRMEFRSTKEARNFNLWVTAMGSIFSGLLIFGLATGRFKTGALNSVLVVSPFLMMTATMTCLGLYLMHRSSIPIIFDKSVGYFWKGRSAEQGKSIQRPIRLDHIHALQIVSQYGTRSKGGSYYSYELIAVLKNCTRVGLVHHGGRRQMYTDARMLSQFLGCPLWIGGMEG